MAGSYDAQVEPYNWGSLLGAGLGVAGSLYGSKQAKNSIDQGQQAQQGYASTARQDLAPYSALGASAAAKMAGPIDLHSLPGYDQSVTEGESGINRGLAARGQYGSGGALKSLIDFNQKNANKYYGEEFGRLGSMLNSGQNAANAISGINQGLGNSAAAAALQKGNASSAGTNGVGSSLSSYFGTSNGQKTLGSAAGVLSNAAGSAASSIGDLWNQYFGSGYSSDGSTNGGYTGTGNTVDSLTSAGGYQGDTGNGGSGYWNNYIPTQNNGYMDETTGQWFNG